jgi:hypothetical protein
MARGTCELPPQLPIEIIVSPGIGALLRQRLPARRIKRLMAR